MTEHDDSGDELDDDLKEFERRLQAAHEQMAEDLRRAYPPEEQLRKFYRRLPMMQRRHQLRRLTSGTNCTPEETTP